MWVRLVLVFAVGAMCCIAGCSRAKRQAATWPYSGRSRSDCIRLLAEAKRMVEEAVLEAAT
jgi:hypothetical protein